MKGEIRLKKQIVISVMSKDRPGIIADVTGVIYELNGDLADLSQSVLSGFFSMIVIAQFNKDISIKEIKEKISSIKSETALEVTIKEVDSTSKPKDPTIAATNAKNPINRGATIKLTFRP